MTIGQLDASGTTFPVHRFGAPRILFVHGLPGDRSTFAAHAELLEDALTYTQRGFTGGPEGAFTVAAHTEDLCAILDTLEVPVLLVGWSYGGDVALRAALARPSRVRALFLYEPSLRALPPADEAAMAIYSEDAETMFVPIAATLEAARWPWAMRALIEASAGPGSWVRLSEERRERYRAHAYVLPRLFAAPPPEPVDYGALEVPCRVRWGARTRPAFEVPARALAALLPGDHGPVEGAGHLWPEDDVAGFVAEFRTWASALERSDPLNSGT